MERVEGAAKITDSGRRTLGCQGYGSPGPDVARWTPPRPPRGWACWFAFFTWEEKGMASHCQRNRGGGVGGALGVLAREGCGAG